MVNDSTHNINFSMPGGSAIAGGNGPPSSPSSPLLINNPQLNLMASYLREINAGTHGMGAQMEKAMSGMGIKFNLAGILKQSQLFTGVIGSVFQILGAAVDIILAAFMPILIPAIRVLASALPRLREFVERYLSVAVEWIVKIWQWITGDKTQEGIKTTLDAFMPDWLPYKEQMLTWLSDWKHLGMLAAVVFFRAKIGSLLIYVTTIASSILKWVFSAPSWLGKLLGLPELFKWMSEIGFWKPFIAFWDTFKFSKVWTAISTGLEPILKVFGWLGGIGSGAFRSFFKIPAATGSALSVVDDVAALGARTGPKLYGPTGKLISSAIEKPTAYSPGQYGTHPSASQLKGLGISLDVLTSPRAMGAAMTAAIALAVPGSKIGAKATAKGFLPLIGAMIIFAEGVGDTIRNYNQLRESGSGMIPATFLASFTALATTVNSILAIPLPMVGWGTSELTNYLENQMYNILKGPTGENRSLFDYTDVGAVKSIILSFKSPSGEEIQHIVDGTTLQQAFTQENGGDTKFVAID